MRRIHIALAIIYGIIWTCSYIYSCNHYLPDIYRNITARLYLPMGANFVLAAVIISWLMKAINREDIILASWYSVVLPTILGIVLFIIILAHIAGFRINDDNLEHSRYSYIAVAISCAAALPLSWHLALSRRHREGSSKKET